MFFFRCPYNPRSCFSSNFYCWCLFSSYTSFLYGIFLSSCCCKICKAGKTIASVTIFCHVVSSLLSNQSIIIHSIKKKKVCRCGSAIVSLYTPENKTSCTGTGSYLKLSVEGKSKICLKCHNALSSLSYLKKAKKSSYV